MLEHTKNLGEFAKKGNRFTVDHKKKISRALLNSKNGMWRGDLAKVEAIHKWVQARKSKPKFCEICGVKPPKDLANISQDYKRDVKDFKWICRKCHMTEDGRIKKMGEIAKIAGIKAWEVEFFKRMRKVHPRKYEKF